MRRFSCRNKDCVAFYWIGRPDAGGGGRGRTSCSCSRMLRIPRHSAFTQWHRPGASPSSPWLRQKLKVPLGSAPGLLSRMPRASKHSSNVPGSPAPAPSSSWFLPASCERPQTIWYSRRSTAAWHVHHLLLLLSAVIHVSPVKTRRVRGKWPGLRGRWRNV